ncbi:Dihydrolipoyllysine-residue succinyltransferase component of 2-oxoglutarate dehydrogenase complex [Enhygromyxa salina]|uniref:Dihydrolipoyllysine-residue succinyltransferase component of 2-oxoglutarate dehydrogenase complex n=1 Tax=Enhygromyxa salina TaxID=215803 RepID=A0A2S9XEK5_9BACT|nr:2-oxoglutarate dehydrogenase complex dihydrolipoyllysine-residue succinyltransferase [Enhygromyxa salina]PRP91299.1 Dihydrolipoyllysine-residue succinyltransferase component of 2-oxoglutarate dehydrogenase complex [Enhygromyxa salina]
MATIKVPALGESITEAIVAKWLKQPGDAIAADEPVVELETDKITVELPSPDAGVLGRQLATEGDTVNVGDAIFEVEAGASAAAGAKAEAGAAADAAAQAEAVESAAAKPAPAPAEPAEPATQPAAMPAARAEAARTGVDLAGVEGTGRGGRLLKEDVQRAAAAKPAAAPAARPAAKPAGERERRVKMRPLRKTIAARLVAAQQEAAILTTFNEVDMSAVMQTRKAFKQDFIDAHGVKLGFMSFFVKAAVSALEAFPSVNAEIDGDEIVYKQYYNVGVAVGGGKGLVVPVVRDADALGFAAIEQEIGRLAKLARDNKLKLSDLSDGTFTISNGGIYGSMLSTPILNTPQTGILGLHNIVQRPVAVDGKVEIRPIMYLALSYDHRLVDGREAVQFLIHIKQAIEDPRRLLLDL